MCRVPASSARNTCAGAEASFIVPSFLSARLRLSPMRQMSNRFACSARRSGGFGPPTLVMEIGVRCGTLTTRTGCCFLNDPALYAKSCASLPPEINIPSSSSAPVVSMASARTSCVCGRLLVVYVH